MVGEQGSVDDLVAVEVSLWGEDLRRYTPDGEYRMLHTHLVHGNLDKARGIYEHLIAQVREVGNDMGQYVGPDQALGLNGQEIREVLYGKR